jgi:hypothetical protein
MAARRASARLPWPRGRLASAAHDARRARGPMAGPAPATLRMAAAPGVLHIVCAAPRRARHDRRQGAGGGDARGGRPSCWFEMRCRGFVLGDRKVVHEPQADEAWYFDLAADPDEDHPLLLETMPALESELQQLHRLPPPRREESKNIATPGPCPRRPWPPGPPPTPPPPTPSPHASARHRAERRLEPGPGTCDAGRCLFAIWLPTASTSLRVPPPLAAGPRGPAPGPRRRGAAGGPRRCWRPCW